VHIVPIWDKAKGRLVDTVWPGIGELRTTAFRTKSYAGRDATVFGPDETREFKTKDGTVKVTFPSFAQVTVYRVVNGERVAFTGPTTYWMETYASTKDGAPNSMWAKRPRGQIDKCAEAAALRAAFPEELGDELTSDEAPTIYQHSQQTIAVDPIKSNGVQGLKETLRRQVENTAKDETPVETEQETEPESAEVLAGVDEIPFK
jgi:phage recombination protein Bet